MASRTAAGALARLLRSATMFSPSTLTPADLRGPAAMALAQAWRAATGAVGAGVVPQPRSFASGSGAGGDDGHASSSGFAPAPPGRVAEMAALFTCNVCDHRSAHGFSRAAYERGVVIVTCAGCSSRHLLSDCLGWFGAPGSIEAFLAERGDAVVRARTVEAGTGGATLELSAEDLDGWTPPPPPPPPGTGEEAK